MSAAWFIRHRCLAPGALILGVAVLAAIAAPLLAPYDPDQIDLLARLQPPTPFHPAGTDEVGRDILSRLLYGARASLGVGFGIVAIGASFGSALGLYSGYVRGPFDAIAMRALDAVMALPGLVVALALTAALGPSLINAMLALGVLSIPQYARLSRSLALGLRETGYVKVSRTMGASAWRQLCRNILPNAISPILIYASGNLGAAILASASLSFIGLGAQPPLPEWGAMINAARAHVLSDAWYPLFPGLCVLITVLVRLTLGHEKPLEGTEGTLLDADQLEL